MKNLIAFLIVALFSLSAAATEGENLTDLQRFRRLSLITTGQDLAAWQRDEIKVARREGRIERLFADWSRQMVERPEFAVTMTGYMNQEFRVRPIGMDRYNNFSLTSLNLRFLDLIGKNRNWDELLLSQDAVLSYLDIATNRAGVRFYSPVLSETEKVKLQQFVTGVQVRRAEDTQSGVVQDLEKVTERSGFIPTNSSHVAGVLTDPSWLDRLPTTPINQNRKRAAAVFRVFLCDEMRAVILPDEAAFKELEDAGLRKRTSATPAQVFKHGSQRERHANDERCATCHYKLDPLGNIFKGISGALNPTPVAGRLSYKRRDGSLLNLPFRNMQELAKTLVAQPEYNSCQVRHFWNWFVGKDVPLSARTERELTDKFISLGKKPRDFALYLVGRPEFHRFPGLSLDMIKAPHVSGILKDCNSCHANDAMAPDLAALPFTKFGIDAHVDTVGDLVKVLDLLGDGGKASMPTRNAGWKLKQDDRELLSAWIAGGAKSDSGEATFTNPEVQSRLRQKLMSEKVSLELRPSFDFTAKRRLGKIEVQRNLERLFKELNPSGALSLGAYEPGENIRNLETGATPMTPPPQYIRGVMSSVVSFRNSLTIGSEPEELARFNLEWLGNYLEELADYRFRKDMTFGEEDEASKRVRIDESPEINELDLRLKIIMSLHERIFGWVPSSSSAKYAQFERYARSLAPLEEETKSLNTANNHVQKIIGQLILSSDYLIY